MTKRHWILFPVTALFIGCAPWMVVGGMLESTKHEFKADLPKDWKRPRSAEHLMITRDGLDLQRIDIRRIDHGKPFGAGERTFQSSMLPQEAADMLIDAVRTSSTHAEVELIESGPRTIDGETGFAFTFRAKRSGLKVRGAVRGIVGPKGVHVLTYEAPERYYYEKDLSIFERVVDSFKRTGLPKR